MPDSRHAAVRDRLDALRAPTPAPAPAPAPGEPEPLVSPRGWRERWLPASWHGARVDPGRRGGLALAGVAVVAALLAVLGVWRDRPVTQAAPALPVVETAASTSSSAAPPTSTVPATLVVSVAGAVARPGLVTLPAGARVDDAITAAGGPLPGTDLLTLNRAQGLTDGEQVLVGVAGAPVSGGGAPSAPAGSSGGATGLVNLNSAGESELEGLPGVGPVMAAAIITHREDTGGFTSVDQLTDVSGIGDARFAQLKDLVTV